MIKIYGPYQRKDGRSHVIHYDTITQAKRTQSYPRYLMEQHLERILEDWEQVDHINNDHTDNRIENLQILTVKENNRKSSPLPKKIKLICKYCGKEYRMSFSNYKHKKYKMKQDTGYCSKQCVGKVYH